MRHANLLYAPLSLILFQLCNVAPSAREIFISNVFQEFKSSEYYIMPGVLHKHTSGEKERDREREKTKERSPILLRTSNKMNVHMVNIWILLPQNTFYHVLSQQKYIQRNLYTKSPWIWLCRAETCNTTYFVRTRFKYLTTLNVFFLELYKNIFNACSMNNTIL